jgi:hypothetical protein
LQLDSPVNSKGDEAPDFNSRSLVQTLFRQTNLGFLSTLIETGAEKPTMAEFAAALIGIISAGTKVAMVLSTTASNVGSAGKEAQVMAREIRSFCTILRNISQTIEIAKDSDQVTHCSELISEMTIVSQEMFNEILTLVDSMQKESWAAGPSVAAGPRLNLARRIKWAINKPRLTFLRTAIEAYKADLCLLLGSMHVVQGLEARKYVSKYARRRVNMHLTFR